MNLFNNLTKRGELFLLVCISAIFFVFRMPSLIEPYWYGDEGIYETIGLALFQGRHLYKEIWDNKPPFLYLLYGIFGGDQFSIRLTSLIIGILAIVTFYFLAKRLYGNTKTAAIATFVLAFLFGTPLLEGNIANAENFMIFPTLLAATVIFKTQTLKARSLLLAGLLCSVSFLFKIVGIFDAAAFGVFLLLINTQDIASALKSIFKLIPFVLGVVVPIIITMAYFFLSGSFKEFSQAVFTNMVGYVGYGNQFIIPQGLLILKLSLLGIALLFLWINRKTIPTGTIFITTWFVFSVFNAFFAGRPYIHYLLTLLPSFALFTGLVFQQITSAQKKFEFLTIGLYVGVLILVLNFFKLYDKPISYYQNFLAYVSHQKNTPAYYRFFDRNTPRDYQLAEFIKLNTKPQDNIFIWGDNAQVYKLTGKLPPGRFTVAYHMNANQLTKEETRIALQKQSPVLIIVTSPNNPLPYTLPGYTQRIGIEGSIIYERSY